jgi:hypothetical protein
MARVQMLIYVGGGRGDGSDWPPPGGILVCGDAEARDLIAGHLARWPPDEERAVMPPGGAEPAAGAPEGGDAGDEAADGESGSQPRVRDPKETWEMHAVQVHGATPEIVAAMTKADLIENFGGAASQ